MGIRGQYKNKRDANEPEIFTELRAYGLSVHPMDTPADALVGWLGRSYLVEVKQPKGKLTGPQEAFLETWKGDFTILRTVEEAAEFARILRAGSTVNIPIIGQIIGDRVVK
jgi:hypothetical protein